MSPNVMRVAAELAGGRITATFEGTGDWRRALDVSQKSDWWRRVAAGEEAYFVEYSHDIDVPASVAVIPALLDVLPLAWLTDTMVELDEIDAHFAAALPFIKHRYETLYPELNWGGGVTWRSAAHNHVGQASGNPLTLFSGGVDAVFTALANIALEPVLTTVWGADMFFHDVEGWERVRTANKEFADRLGLDFVTIKSSFRTCVDYGYLDPTFGKPVKDNWWHAYQFGPALSSLAVPAAFSRRADTVFLASDYSKKDPFVNRSASDAALVQEIRVGGTGVKCHDFTASRQDKVRFICAFGKSRPEIEIPLRVCWRNGAGGNCGKCEKCMRTQFAIMGCGSDPRDFGFELGEEKQDEIVAVLESGKFPKTAFWREIVRDLRDSSFAEDKIAKALLTAQS